MLPIPWKCVFPTQIERINPMDSANLTVAIDQQAPVDVFKAQFYEAVQQQTQSNNIALAPSAGEVFGKAKKFSQAALDKLDKFFDQYGMVLRMVPVPALAAYVSLAAKLVDLLDDHLGVDAAD